MRSLRSEPNRGQSVDLLLAMSSDSKEKEKVALPATGGLLGSRRLL